MSDVQYESHRWNVRRVEFASTATRESDPAGTRPGTLHEVNGLQQTLF